MAEIEEEKSGAKTSRSNRGATMMRETLLFVFLLFVAVPTVVGISFHLLGWHIAVLLLPVLYLLTFLANPIARQRRGPVLWFGRWIGWFIVFGIPLVAVYTGDPNLMRLWAIAVAARMFAKMNADKRAAANMTNGWIRGSKQKKRAVFALIVLSVAALFILLSELIWRYLSLGSWIWFHAFAVTIFTTLWVSTIALVSKVVSGGVFGATQQPLRQKGRRPSIRSSPDTDRYKAEYKQANGTITVYEDISPEQTKWLLARVNWGSETLPGKEPVSTGDHGPKFTIDFDWLNLITLRPCGVDNLRIDWMFGRPRKKWQLSSARDAYVAKAVPRKLANEIIDLAWADKWDDIEVLLRSFIDPDELPTA